MTPVLPRWVIIALSLAFVANGCEGRRRMHHDQQIGLLSDCEQARRECLAAPEAEREAAISRWVSAVNSGNGLCAGDLHDALVLKDDQSYQLALEVMKRIQWHEIRSRLLADLDSEHRSPEQRERAAATLKALTDQDFGKDRAAWEAWFRGQR